MKKLLALGLLITTLVGAAFGYLLPSPRQSDFDTTLQQAFSMQGFKLSTAQVNTIRDNAHLGVIEACKQRGNSKVDFTAVEIAQLLKLNTQTDPMVVNRISKALELISAHPDFCAPNPIAINRPIDYLGWNDYYNKTLSLNTDNNFLKQLRDKDYSPVKISWEDIGRYQNNVWGDRISDVGIWVRKDENDPNSAQLALSVRRDNNYRDKVLVVPAEKIKIHQKIGSQIIEKTLPQRLKEIGLSSALRDKDVIVSNQFSIVPVPAYNMSESRSKTPPRVAFNFSIYPYGSTNYVITDVIEGSSEALVGQGTHQLLYMDVNGQKAPFTASRAKERQDLLQLQQKLKAKGMDVDVQRYYLIQIPLKSDIQGLELSNMGSPPSSRGFSTGMSKYKSGAMFPLDDNVSLSSPAMAKMRGLEQVAIGHGDIEGAYNTGSGYYGQRADEPIRVTVVYFVTPVGDITQDDIQGFANTFATWDNQAIWGGSFVTKMANN